MPRRSKRDLVSMANLGIVRKMHAKRQQLVEGKKGATQEVNQSTVHFAIIFPIKVFSV